MPEKTQDIDLTPHDNGLPGGDYPRTACDCGYDVIYTPEGWQHDAAPYLWGDDHDPSVSADDEAVAERWQAAYDAIVDAIDRGIAERAPSNTTEGPSSGN